MKRVLDWALVLASVATVAGCGSDDWELTVSAAASLTEAFERYAPGDARLSFGGSDELAAQIRQGARPDVFAAANTDLPEALFAEGLVERPESFATNRLVIAVPEGSRIDAISDLSEPGTDVVMGAPAVPVGSYTREVLDRLSAAEAIRANVRSEESDVTGIVGKVTQGAADAGFVYESDVVAAGGELRSIELPESLQPRVTYGIAVVNGTDDRAAARAFIEGLRSGAGARILRDAGFGPPPRP